MSSSQRAAKRQRRQASANDNKNNNEALIAADFAAKGVSLKYLRSLEVGPDASFHDVRDTIVKLTANAQGNRSLASHLMQSPSTKHLVGKADYFVSYAWSGGFAATMDALTNHMEGKPDPYVWMDIAMVDQHAAASTDLDFNMWSETFRESLTQIGKAILVLTPAEKPIAISRSWCCFEWASIKQANIPFEFCVNPIDGERLVERMEDGMGFDDFNDIFAGINVEKASAFKPSDQAAILALMRGIGLKEVNDVIMFSVKDWLLRVATQAERTAPYGAIEGTKLLNAKASLHQALGEYDEALPLFEKALKSSREVPDYETGVATSLNNLAGLLRDKGDYAGAEPLYCESLAIRKKVLGDDHPQVATSLNNLAGLLQDKGDYTGAEPLYRESLAISKKALGDDHPKVATSLSNLAALLQDKRDYVGAEPLYRESLAIMKKVLGDDHPNVAKSMNNLAKLLQEKGDYVGAEPLFRESLAIMKKVLGDEHPDVAASLNNLAVLIRAKGDYVGAEPLYRESLAIMKKVLGDDHPNVAKSMNNLAKLLQEKGDYVGAEPLFRESLAIRKKALGDDHPAVAMSLNNLARLLQKQGKTAEAKQLGMQALSICKRVLRVDDPRTIAVQKSWGQ